MGNFELVNLIKENEEKDGEEDERFTITMVPYFVSVFFFLNLFFVFLSRLRKRAWV